jgi:hypothetical protein
MVAERRCGSCKWFSRGVCLAFRAPVHRGSLAATHCPAYEPRE